MKFDKRVENAGAKLFALNILVAILSVLSSASVVQAQESTISKLENSPIYKSILSRCDSGSWKLSYLHILSEESPILGWDGTKGGLSFNFTGSYSRLESDAMSLGLYDCFSQFPNGEGLFIMAKREMVWTVAIGQMLPVVGGLYLSATRLTAWLGAQPWAARLVSTNPTIFKSLSFVSNTVTKNSKYILAGGLVASLCKGIKSGYNQISLENEEIKTNILPKQNEIELLLQRRANLIQTYEMRLREFCAATNIVDMTPSERQECFKAR